MFPATRLPRRLPVPALFVCLLLAAAPASAATVRGTVFDAKQQPLSGVTLTLAAGTGPARATETDAQGRYEFADLAPGHYAVVARKAGFASQRQAVTVARPDQLLGIYFRLQPWAAVAWSVTGTVLREDGKTPLAGAQVHLMRERLPGNHDRAGETTTEETGFFAFTELKPGRYRLSVSATGYLSDWGEEFLVREGADQHSIDITLQPPPPHTIPGTVVGEIMDATGQPLAKKEASLRLDGPSVMTRLNWGEGLRRRSWSQRSGGAGGIVQVEIKASVQTDDGGRFRFTVPPGTYTVKLWAEGFLSQTQPLKVEAGQECLPLSFRLTPGEDPAAKEDRPQQAPPRGTIRGRVLRPDGTPLANTGIYLFTAPNIGSDPRPWGRSNYMGLAAEAHLTTDGEGRFVKTNVQPGTALVAVKTRGFAESEAARVEVSADTEAQVELRLPGPSLSICGRVTGADGKPFAGARVFAYRVLGTWQDDHFWNALSSGFWGQGDAGPWPFDARIEDLKPGVVPGLLRHGITYAETDAEGRFTLKELDTGVHHFGATAPGWSRESREAVALGGDTAAPALAFALQQLGGIEGVVLRPDGKPLGPLEVQIGPAETTRPNPTTQFKQVNIDGAGRYRLADLQPGTYRLILIASGFPQIQRENVVVPAGKTVGGIDFRLEVGLTLRGRVLQPDDVPAEGALVRWRSQQGWGVGGASATTGPDGTFELKGLEAGAGYVQASATGLAPDTRQITLPLAKDATLELRLAPVTTVRGTIRDRAGKPIEEAYVSWSVQDSVGHMFGDYQRSSARTDAAGAYALSDVPRRKVTISANKEGYRYASAPQDLSAPQGEATVDLVLEQLRYGKLRGRVLRADGTPAPGIRVQVSTENAPGVRVVTDAEGRFASDRVPVGLAWLYPEGEFLRERPQVEITEGAEAVAPDIRLAAAGVIEGKITGRERLPQGAQVSLYLEADLDAAEERKAPAGGWPHLYFALPQADLRSALSSTFRKVAMRWQWVLGSTAGFAWVPVPRSQPTGHTQVQPDGSFRMERALVGKGRLILMTSGGREGYVSRVLAPVTVAEGQTTRVEAAVQAGGSVKGQVRWPEGIARSERPMLSLFDRKALRAAATILLGADGAFSLAGIPAGDYLAMVWEPGLAGVKRPVTIKVGETATIELDLAAGVTLRGKVEGERPKELFVSAESETGFGGAPVGEDGSFTVEHLLPGSYTLRLWSPETERIATTPGVEVAPTGREGVVLKWQ